MDDFHKDKQFAIGNYAEYSIVVNEKDYLETNSKSHIIICFHTNFTISLVWHRNSRGKKTYQYLISSSNCCLLHSQCSCSSSSDRAAAPCPGCLSMIGFTKPSTLLYTPAGRAGWLLPSLGHIPRLLSSQKCWWSLSVRSVHWTPGFCHLFLAGRSIWPSRTTEDKKTRKASCMDVWAISLCIPFL